MIDRRFDEALRTRLSHSIDELELVRSGLEDSMCTAYQEIREIHFRRKKVKDMRTAAFVCAIKKVASSYRSLGIFP